jgi:hypothetical protein
MLHSDRPYVNVLRQLAELSVCERFPAIMLRRAARGVSASLRDTALMRATATGTPPLPACPIYRFPRVLHAGLSPCDARALDERSCACVATDMHRSAWD